MQDNRGVLVTKICARCKILKPVTEFYPRRTLDGRPFSYCKHCANIVSRDRRDAKRKLLRESALVFVREQLKQGGVANFQRLPRVARIALLDALDVPSRSVTEIARLAGCSEGTVYRHRRDRFIRGAARATQQ